VRADIVNARESLKFTPNMVCNALDALNISYHASDKEAIVHCPFHDDGAGKPHCYINIRERAGTWHCFASSCEARGNFVEFLVGATGWNQYKVLTFSRNLKRGSELNEELLEKLQVQPTEEESNDPLTQYAYRHEYLHERGLGEEVLRRFQVGYDRAKNAIVFPWFDKHGNLVAIKKRRIIDKFFDYNAGADLRHTLYGLHLVRSYGVIWIVEAEIDAMTLDQVFRQGHFDRHYAVALGGRVVQESQIFAMLSKIPSCVVLMLDRDDVGRISQDELKRKLLGRVRVHEAGYPAGDAKDPNELTYDQVVQITTHIDKKEKENQNERLSKRGAVPQREHGAAVQATRHQKEW
jgi:Toprim-like